MVHEVTAAFRNLSLEKQIEAMEVMTNTLIVKAGQSDSNPIVRAARNLWNTCWDALDA